MVTSHGYPDISRHPITKIMNGFYFLSFMFVTRKLETVDGECTDCFIKQRQTKF